MSLAARSILSIVFFLCLQYPLRAKEVGELNFIPNNGQWNDKVLYKADLQDGAVFFMANGFRYNFYDPDDVQDIHDSPRKENYTVSGHAYDVVFSGSRLAAIEGGDKRSYYHNYFMGRDTTKWAANVPVFQDIKYRGLYPNIHMKIYSLGTSLKYDLLVEPGGDVRDIRMQFDGVEPYVNENGDLVIQTSVNTVTEQAPYAYQIVDGIETEVPCRYYMKDRKLSFDFPAGYDKNRLLIIDPVLKFATYSGSTGQLWGYCATYDSSGNFYSGSAAFSTGFPVTTGAYQATYNGNDMAINKYNAAGDTLLYSTYCGGTTGSEYPLTMVVNNSNELIVCGHSYSADYPVTASAIDTTYNGAGDIVVTVFNAAGTALTGSTYLGGSGVEGVSAFAFHDYDQNKVGLCSDAQGNIYIAASTQSKDIPVSPSAFQYVHASTYDGCIFKISRSCSSLLYSTYLGGDHIDCIYDCKLSGNNLIVCGRTISSNFPLSNNAYSDSGNAFVSILSATGQFLVASTKLGPHTESAIKISQDDNGNVFVCGNNDTDFVASPGTFNEDAGKVFVAKMTPALDSMIRCTKLVAQEKPGVTGFVNICGDVVGSVLLKEIKTLPVTPDAYQSSPSAYYFFHLSPAMDTLVYATFYGVPNDPIKGGHAHSWSAIDTNGVIWLSTCNKDSKYSIQGTSNSYAPGSLSGVHNYDHLSAKFDMEVLPAKPLAHALIPDTVCARTDIYFGNQSAKAYNYIWYFGDGDTSHAKYPVHRYDYPGYYTVKLEAYNPYSCRAVDSMVHTLFADTNEIYSSFVAGDTACPGRTVNFYNTSKNGVSTLWLYGDGSTATSFHGQHVYNAPGTYLVRLVTYNPLFCNKTDTATHLLVIDTTNPGAAFSISNVISCADKPIQFMNSTKRGISYAWDFGDGSTANVLSPLYIYKTGGKHTVRLIATNNNLCVPHDTAYGSIEILPPLQIDLADTFICGGKTPVSWGIKLVHVNSFPTYKWEPANAVISGGAQSVAIVDPRIATKYFVTVTDSIPGMCSHIRTDTAVLSILDYPEGVFATANSPLCEGDTLRLEGVASSNIPLLTYRWTGPDAFYASGQSAGRGPIKRHQGGKYKLGVSNNGCETYAETDVVVKPAPFVEAGSNSPVWSGSELRLTMKSDIEPDTFFWAGPNGFYSSEKFPVINPVKPQNAGTYTITAMRDGCIGGDITIVTVPEPDSQYLRLYPNPNNGTFFIEGKGYNEQQVKMLIVNSIGQKIYRADVNTEKKHFRHQVALPAVSGGVYIMWVLLDGEYRPLPFTILRK